MGIVGDHPETGIRIEVERPREGGPPWLYSGAAVTPDGRFPIEAALSADGEVTFDAPPGAPDGLAEKARLLLRVVWKRARADEMPPPRRIMRWHAGA